MQVGSTTIGHSGSGDLSDSGGGIAKTVGGIADSRSSITNSRGGIAETMGGIADSRSGIAYGRGGNCNGSSNLKIRRDNVVSCQIFYA